MLLRTVFVGMLLVALAAGGCTEVRGRHKIQAGNKLYKDGLYKEAVAKFVEAEELVPQLPILWLNKGYTCRQMVIPGATTPESINAAKCALTAFKRLQELAPTDSRAELLYVQTLFDADQYELLVKMYEDQYKQNPKNIDAVSGLIQTYSKWQKLDESLEWYAKKAELRATDPEAQYAVGVYIWQNLAQKGGGQDKAVFDPRPNPDKPKDKKIAPPFGYGDLVSQQRIDLADTGIKYLQKAIDLKPKYHEAMTYLNLLQRQKSFAYFDQPAEWQKCIDLSMDWARKSLETQGKPIPANLMQGAKPAGGDDDDDKSLTDGAPASTDKGAGKKKAQGVGRKGRPGRK